MPAPARPSSALLVASVAVLGLGLAACTSSASNDASPKTAIATTENHAPTTINVWTFNHLPQEVTAFKAALERLHAKYPWLTVNFVPNKDDAAFGKAVAAGQAPDVFVSTSPDNVGKFCYNGTVAPLDDYLKAAKVDVDATFPKAALVYTRFQDKQCALPLLVDAYGLFYNKKMLADAGVTPPKTLSELTAAAKKLTVKNKDGSIKRFGFVSRSDYNSNNSLYDGVQAGTQYYGTDGKSTLGQDARWNKIMQWDRDLNDWYGNGQVSRFVAKFQPHTDDAKNPLITGDVAMEVDGEWHVGEIADAKTSLDYGVVPVPMLDDVKDTYGAGTAVGTVAYLPAGSKHKQEAFFALQQLTTDTEFLTSLADTVYNIPSTFDSLSAWDKKDDEHWGPLVAIFANKGSYYKQLTPAGDEDAITWGTARQQYETGKSNDLQGLLKSTGAKIDKINEDAVG
ncbi:ABC transporter substrate-binding protein [Angustibacter sp. McL0619]|uniref:ABC transporter substrate-binding protein n=1 Tax=Angustibacter sp. McL0619 TaxID=3415676 RepID=UPI003CF95B6D